MKVVLFLALSATAFAQLGVPKWVPQTSGTMASLRGIRAAGASVVWASGTGGTWLRTTNGGETWRAAVVPGAEQLDFRGVSAPDARTAWLMSSGEGDKSRVYKTTDGGDNWKLLFTNPDAKGFFDGIAFRDSEHGMLLGDAVEGRMTVFSTTDGGSTWVRQQTPAALPEEGAFAASNSSLALAGKSEGWFATGGRGAARVFHSPDFGRTWTVVSSPIRADAASAGIFSLAFANARLGIAVGGDYAKDWEPKQNIAVTTDGGTSWKSPAGPGPGGFRSAVVWVPERRLWAVTGTSGSDFSADNGQTWQRFDDGAYNALSAAPGPAVWAVGPKGRIAKLSFSDR